MGEELRDEMKGLKIGEKIASLRKAKKLSRLDLAEKSGLTEIIISQIESDIISPTVAALIRISRALEKELGYFFQDREDEARVEVVRKNERKTVKRRRSSGDYALSYSYQSLSFRREKHMQPFLVEFDIDVDEDISLLTHEGEEFLFLLSGDIEMRTDNEVILLKEGDCIYFDSSVHHGFIGRGGLKPRALVTVYTPERSAYD
jgi:transcriptional regulator with XRE-family HTH domain